MLLLLLMMMMLLLVLLQCGRVPLRGVQWVHVDAHPDLLLPPTLTPHAALGQDPEQLYHALE
jgi:hypothetical protein